MNNIKQIDLKRIIGEYKYINNYCNNSLYNVFAFNNIQYSNTDTIYINYFINLKNKEGTFILKNVIHTEIHELFTEHLHNIEVLIIQMNDYNTIHHRLMSKHNLTVEQQMQEDMFIRSKQIQIYCGDILPIIQIDAENLNEIINMTEIK